MDRQPRNPDLRLRPDALEWIIEHPAIEARLTPVLSFLQASYIKDNHGWIEKGKGKPPEYIFSGRPLQKVRVQPLLKGIQVTIRIDHKGISNRFPKSTVGPKEKGDPRHQVIQFIINNDKDLSLMVDFFSEVNVADFNVIDQSMEVFSGVTDEIERKGIDAKAIKLREAYLEGHLKRWIKKEFGYYALSQRAVGNTDDKFDLLIENSATQKKILIECKIRETAKKTIRSALGQLITYSTYPGALTDITELWVAGDKTPTKKDKIWLEELNKRYNTMIRYAWHEIETPSLFELL